MNNERQARIKLISSMLIFGTIGVFVRYLDLPSSITAMARGYIGAITLLIVCAIIKHKLDKNAIKDNLLLLVISGIVIGFNWILLFESYNHTTVAIATLCYYMQPIFVTLLSPIVLKEKTSAKKIICVFIALLGMYFVSGIIGGNNENSFLGMALGVGAGLLYATVILMNKKLKPIPAYDQTIIQLASAATILVPYCFLTVSASEVHLDTVAVIMLLILGVVHTGITYSLYFGSMPHLKASTIAIFSYIDPILSVILSAIILKENLNIYTIIGAILILGSTFVSEMNFKKKRIEE